MTFYLQDPTIPYLYTLHEALLQACLGAETGGGAYAFVSQDGVKLLLEDSAFRSFVENGTFKLVVGIDEITNENALRKLRELREMYKGLNIVAFLHDVKGALFHPKFTWFRNKHGGMLVVGSGNLTARGLRRNWEAFSTVQLNKQEIKIVESDWNKWITHQDRYLKSIDDEAVLEKARANRWIRPVKKLEDESQKEPSPITEQQLQDAGITEDTEAWDFTTSDDVLIAEIPRSGNRWNQANFDIETFKDFFGAKPGDNSQRILLRNVKNNGLLSDIEIRPSVSVISQNYRFELEAAAGLEYPSDGRPVGLFIRVSPRMFLYLIAMPSNSYYAEVRGFLDSRSAVHAIHVKRIRTNVLELQTNCTNLPFWKITK
jgi:HKD family nuclease